MGCIGTHSGGRGCGLPGMTPHELVDTLKKHARFTGGKPHSARAKLQNEDLSGIRLPGINLSQAVLTGINFSGAGLDEANFAEADLFAAEFRKAELTRAEFVKADLRGARFRGATVTEATFENADLRPGSILSLVSGDGAADLTGANLDGVNMIGANLEGAVLTGTVLEGANLASLVGGQATMARTTSSLRLSVQKILSDHALWAESNGASGARAELRDARLRNAKFDPIELKGPDGTLLGRAAQSNLTGADLRGADNFLVSCSKAQCFSGLCQTPDQDEIPFPPINPDCSLPRPEIRRQKHRTSCRSRMTLRPTGARRSAGPPQSAPRGG